MIYCIPLSFRSDRLVSAAQLPHSLYIIKFCMQAAPDPTRNLDQTVNREFFMKVRKLVGKKDVQKGFLDLIKYVPP